MDVQCIHQFNSKRYSLPSRGVARTTFPSLKSNVMSSLPLKGRYFLYLNQIDDLFPYSINCSNCGSYFSHGFPTQIPRPPPQNPQILLKKDIFILTFKSSRLSLIITYRIQSTVPSERHPTSCSSLGLLLYRTAGHFSF